MYRTKLKFANIEELIEFTLVIDIARCAIDKEAIEIACTMKEMDVELAKSGFGAYIVSMHKLQLA
jgi:hypothetical protein